MTASSDDETQSAETRNELAAIRTDLANERTLLAYGRTSLMLVGTGGTLIKFFGDDPRLLVTGITSLVLGAVLMLFGINRFRRAARSVQQHRR